MYAPIGLDVDIQVPFFVSALTLGTTTLTVDKLKLAGQSLGHVLISRSDCAYAIKYTEERRGYLT